MYFVWYLPDGRKFTLEAATLNDARNKAASYCKLNLDWFILHEPEINSHFYQGR